MRTLAAALVSCMLLTLPSAGRAAAISPEHAQLEGFAHRIGVDVRAILDAPMRLETLHIDGSRTMTTLRVADILDRLERARAMTTPVAGPAEINAGDVAHAYYNICFFCATAKRYTVTTSAIVPATPPVQSPLPFVEVSDRGGPLVQVKGSGWTTGAHSAGMGYGNNVDTGEGSPTGVWLPFVTGALLADTSVDFTGHATVTQGDSCSLFGTVCIAVGAIVGDGVTLFDNTSGVSTPRIP